MQPSGRNFSQYSTHFNARPPVAFTPRNLMTQESLPPDLNIMDGLIKTPLKSVSIPVDDPDQDDVVVKDCTYIGSYNWTKRETPTIIVPGMISHIERKESKF